MESITLKKIDEQVSELALGTMYLNTLVDKDSSKSILDFYHNNGGNFIDTANMYVSWVDGFTGGESERLIGEWITEKKNRHELFISTKVGLPMKGVPAGLDKNLIIKECENSLKRMNIDTIDLYFVHHEDPHTPMEGTLEALDTLKKQGKIRHTGISNHRSFKIAESQKISELRHLPEFTFAQYRYTYLRPKLGTPFFQDGDTRMHCTEDLLDYIHDNDMNFMCYQTILSGAYSNNNKQIPLEYLGPDSDERLKMLKVITEETGASINQVVLAWAMQNRMKSIPLVTASNLGQMEENLKVCDLKLTVDQIQRLDEAGL